MLRRAVRELRVVNGGRSRLRGLSLTGRRAALSLRGGCGASAGGGRYEVRADERRRGQQEQGGKRQFSVLHPLRQGTLRFSYRNRKGYFVLSTLARRPLTAS